MEPSSSDKHNADQIFRRKKRLRKKKNLIIPRERPILKPGQIANIKSWWTNIEKKKKGQADDKELRSVMVKFVTKQPQYAVSAAPVSVKETARCREFNNIISLFLKEAAILDEIPQFEFLIDGKILRQTIGHHFEENGQSFEKTTEIQYFERHPPPTPKDNLEHDDWVSSVMSYEDWLLTGSYDNTVQLWSIDANQKGLGKRAHKLTIPAHMAPVKGVCWVKNTNNADVKSFVSCSIDQTAIVWEWDSIKNSVTRLLECRGHSQSVECIHAADTKFATGSWDNKINIWSLDPISENQSRSDEEPNSKKEKSNKIKTPLLTLKGHSESVSSLQLIDGAKSLISCSWDHSIRLWDLSVGGKVSQINGNVAFFSISHSPVNGLVVGSCADRHIRLYDVRANEGSIVLNRFGSHTKWISCVRWHPSDENRFVSASHDHDIRVWDRRSSKVSLYSLKGHNDKVLSVDWSEDNFICSGSADCTAQVYAADLH